MPSKVTFKDKITKIFFIILGFLGSFFVGFLIKTFFGKNQDEKEAETKMTASVNTVKSDIDTINATVDELQNAVNSAQEMINSNTADSRLDSLENAGVIGSRRKK
jgi:hypothetical protein